MCFIGIDLGSVATKGVLIKDNKFYSTIVPTGWNPKEAGENVISKLLTQVGISMDQVKVIVGTGYGRISLPFLSKKVTEIACHAKGNHYLFPAVDLIIDIGGQDSKIIKLNQEGKVQDFIMNDKCAAGTGRFLQGVSGVLDCTLDELGTWAMDVCKPIQINSMCAVFAESEIIGLLAQGVEKEKIAAGVLDSICIRIAGMAQRVGPFQKVAFSGGLAQLPGFSGRLSSHLKTQVDCGPNPQIVGALGAALLAVDFEKKDDNRRD
jgi:predicted CoA-substrate-specific enzyme activase